MIPISYNVRSLWVRKATTSATALGIALVVFVLASSQMLALGIERTMGGSGRQDHGFVLRKGADAELSSAIDQNQVGLITSAVGVAKDASGKPRGVGEVLLVVTLEKPDSGGQIANVQVRGVPDGELEFRDEAKIIAGRPARPGSDEVMIGKRIRGQFIGLEIGQSFELKKNRKAQVVGVFEANGSSFESEIWADIETIRTSFGREAMVSSVTVQLQSASSFDAFKAAIESDKQLNLQVMREREYFEKQSEGSAKFIKYLGGAIVFFFSVGAMIGAMITMYAAVTNRRREIGTLRALGFPRYQIMLSFLFESFALALIGGAIGVTGALGMGFVQFSMMNMSTWSEITFSFDPSPNILMASMAIGGLMGIFGGLLPAIAAAKTSPIEAMRD